LSWVFERATLGGARTGDLAMTIIVKPHPSAAVMGSAGFVRAALCGTALLLLTLGACSKLGSGQDEMRWARAALDRNDRLQVVASDSQARTFTVRLKESGDLRVVPLDQIVAGAELTLPTSKSEGAKAAAAPGAAGDGTPGQSAADAPSTGAGPAQLGEAAQGARGGSPSGADAAQANTQVAQANSSRALSTGQPAEASSGALAGEPAWPTPEARSEAADAKVGRMLVSGPGYSIKASGSKGASTRASSLAGVGRGTPERLHDPIICQGSRLLHIDNRNLEFDGDAVSAQDGCEIHITNTHITAKGVGVLARAANVHIANSEIEGDSGAIDASDGAQVYAESSRFKGLTRRMESSELHDLGGNVWN
jgi:hypothetical protein